MFYAIADQLSRRRNELTVRFAKKGLVQGN